MSSNNQERIESASRFEAVTGTAYSDNGLFAYEKYLDFPVEKYFSCRVLDIGSGYGERFNTEAAGQGIKVISLNPELRKESARKKRERSLKRRRAEAVDSVAGLAQNLPFKDESFEAVTSLCAIPKFLKPEINEYRQTFSEMVRVLKSGGKAYVFPIDRTEIEGQNVIKMIENLNQVEEVEVFEKSSNGNKQEQGVIITKK